jgi:hypothetical protein
MLTREEHLLVYRPTEVLVRNISYSYKAKSISKVNLSIASKQFIPET